MYKFLRVVSIALMLAVLIAFSGCGAVSPANNGSGAHVENLSPSGSGGQIIAEPGGINTAESNGSKTAAPGGQNTVQPGNSDATKPGSSNTAGPGAE